MDDEYAVLAADECAVLTRLVNEYLTAGWRCSGGVSNCHGRVVQAMLRKRQPTPDPNALLDLKPLGVEVRGSGFATGGKVFRP